MADVTTTDDITPDSAPESYTTESAAPVAAAAPRAVLSVSGQAVGRRKQAIARVRSDTATPILTGLPFGHVPTMVSLPVGRKVTLLVEGRDVLVGWDHDHE